MDRDKVESLASGVYPEVFDRAREIELFHGDYLTQMRDTARFAKFLLEGDQSCSYLLEDNDVAVSTLVRVGDNTEGNHIYLASVRVRDINSAATSYYFTAFVGMPFGNVTATNVNEDGFRLIGKDTRGRACYGFEVKDLRERYQDIDFIHLSDDSEEEFSREKADLDAKLKDIQQTVTLISESVIDLELNPGSRVVLTKLVTEIEAKAQ